jgi:hypothetical protein
MFFSNLEKHLDDPINSISTCMDDTANTINDNQGIYYNYFSLKCI